MKMREHCREQKKEIPILKPLKEDDKVKTLSLTATGRDWWMKILDNMGRGPTPISAFVGRFDVFQKLPKRRKEEKEKRFEIFNIFFVKANLVKPINLENVKRNVYSYDDLNNWQKYLGKPVVYRLTEEGLRLFNKLKKTGIGPGDTIELEIRKDNSN